jgi:hypothetical protein
MRVVIDTTEKTLIAASLFKAMGSKVAMTGVKNEGTLMPN